MPLYMDIHTVDTDDFSVEDVVTAHMQDLAIQDRFGVKQIKYWVNVDAKTIFCLMKGPNKDACNRVHTESHGNTACNIIEVKDDEFNLFFGEGTIVNDLAYTTSGKVDTGYRSLLLLRIVQLDFKVQDIGEELNKIIADCNGVAVIHPDDDIMVSFIYASDSILCAIKISKLLKPLKNKIEFNLSVVSGRPVDEEGNDLFEETKKKITYLNMVGLNSEIYIDETALALAKKENKLSRENYDNLMVVSNDEFNFIFDLFEILNNKLNIEDFRSHMLQKELGVSKSYLYRKIKSLAGIPPNQLIQVFKMRNSLTFLKRKGKTIAETAFDLGFNSPAYFSKVFRRRFKITPTDYINLSL